MAIESFGPIPSSAYTSNLTSASSLTSGMRINQSADDPAGQAIVSNLNTQIDTQDMASRNANDGLSLLQTADAGSQGINDSLLRMNELALQAQNGTYTTEQRAMLNQEFQQNLETIGNLANSTNFNGQNLLNADTASIEIALGESNNTLSLPNLTPDSLGLTGLDISDPANASLALQGLNLANQQLMDSRSQFGAQQNGLTAALENIGNQNLNTLSTRSQISDTDFARAITEQVRQSILNESSAVMQAQNNQSRGNVLQLLGS
ncbi:flagellin N-terminal helical domain-containing protein [Thiomicrorhabdus chilensis]|uniref:flagellin N-terminal helical domain-containing protein n=1 Tax=Thiomicrorhabdus chilensis TaxID=63656 RepID=UPI000491AC6A|nr:flagellin [Thiomicrorhabdus chilensis]